jgi:pimeloyl-ACP methyl ester carboxylesterase
MDYADVGRTPMHVVDEWPYGLPALPSWKDLDWAGLERSVSLRGRTSVNYVDLGSEDDGPPILLLHGIGASYQSWLSMLPALSCGRRVIALDLPGFGRSERPAGVPLTAYGMAEYLDDFCGRLGLEQVDVVGHSMGGFASMQFAHSFASRVHRLGLISASLNSVLQMYRKPAATFLREPVVCLRFCQQMITGSIPLPHLLVRAVMDTPPLRALACAPYVYDARSLDPDMLFEAFSAGGRLSNFLAVMMGFLCAFDKVVEGLADTSGPDILVISGANDQLATSLDAEAFAHRLGRRAKAIVIDRTGHWPMLERPRLLNRLITEWLAE